jgi:hypothetical protein
VTVLAGDVQRPRLFASALALVQLHPTWAALGAALLVAHGYRQPASFTLRQSRPTKNEEKTMTIFEFALLTNALAHLISALATLASISRPRRK